MRKQVRRSWKRAVALTAVLMVSLAMSVNAEETPDPDNSGDYQQTIEDDTNQGKDKTAVEVLVEGKDPLNDVVAINADNFPDDVFRAYISEKFDQDQSGSLSQEEIDSVKTIDFEWGSYEVNNLTGLKYFTSLETLECCYTGIVELDLSQNKVLKRLNCSDTGITSLDVSQNPELNYLECTYTDLTALDVSKNPKLEELHCYETGISALDVSQNPALRRLDCNNTNISSLDEFT